MNESCLEGYCRVKSPIESGFFMCHVKKRTTSQRPSSLRPCRSDNSKLIKHFAASTTNWVSRAVLSFLTRHKTIIIFHFIINIVHYNRLNNDWWKLTAHWQHHFAFLLKIGVVEDETTDENGGENVGSCATIFKRWMKRRRRRRMEIEEGTWKEKLRDLFFIHVIRLTTTNIKHYFFFEFCSPLSTTLCLPFNSSRVPFFINYYNHLNSSS